MPKLQLYFRNVISTLGQGLHWGDVLAKLEVSSRWCAWEAACIAFAALTCTHDIHALTQYIHALIIYMHSLCTCLPQESNTNRIDPLIQAMRRGTCAGMVKLLSLLLFSGNEDACSRKPLLAPHWAEQPCSCSMSSMSRQHIKALVLVAIRYEAAQCICMRQMI